MKSYATIPIGMPEIKTAESAIQEFAQTVPDPLSKKVGSGNETIPSINMYKYICTRYSEQTK